MGSKKGKNLGGRWALRVLRAPPTSMLAAWTRSSSNDSSKRRGLIPIGSISRRLGSKWNQSSSQTTPQPPHFLLATSAPPAAAALVRDAPPAPPQSCPPSRPSPGYRCLPNRRCRLGREPSPSGTAPPPRRRSTRACALRRLRGAVRGAFRGGAP